jgi:hypothetical protein
MTPLDDRALLALWEDALPLAWPAREALFAAHTGAAQAPTVGAQCLQVLDLHRRVSGDALPLRCRCPACNDELGFEIDLQVLAAALPMPVQQAHTMVVDGRELQFRLPAPADVAAADTPDAEDFVARLLARCVEGDAALSPQQQSALAERLEALDPAAALSFVVDCPACAHRWDAAFDPARSLWAFVQARAEQTLIDIDALARRYGWNEAEVLALSPTRRRAYLQLAES